MKLQADANKGFQDARWPYIHIKATYINYRLSPLKALFARADATSAATSFDLCPAC